MSKPDPFAALGDQLPALGRKLGYPSSEAAGTAPAQGRQVEPAAAIAAPSPEDALKSTLAGELLHRIDELARAASALPPSAGSSARTQIETQQAHLTALLDEVGRAHGAAGLQALKGDIGAAIRQSDAVSQSVAATASGAAALAQQRAVAAQSSRFLSESSIRMAERSDELFGWGRLYGVDLAAEEERERDLRRREEELRRQGDMAGALAVRVERIENQIDGYDSLLASPSVPDATKDKIAERRKKALDDLARTQQQLDAQLGAQGAEKSARVQSDRTENVEREYSDEERKSVALERRADWGRMREQTEDVLLPAATADEGERRNAAQALNAAGFGESMRMAFAAAPPVLSPEAQQQAKVAAAPAAAAGAVPSSADEPDKAPPGIKVASAETGRAAGPV